MSGQTHLCAGVGFAGLNTYIQIVVTQITNEMPILDFIYLQLLDANGHKVYTYRKKF